MEVSSMRRESGVVVVVVVEWGEGVHGGRGLF